MPLRKELRPGEVFSVITAAGEKGRQSLPLVKEHLTKNVIITHNHPTLKHRVRGANALSKRNLTKKNAYVSHSAKNALIARHGPVKLHPAPSIASAHPVCV